MPAVRELRTLGASVIKVDAAGAITLAFDGPLADTSAASLQERALAQPKTPAEEERELLFASEDAD